MTDSFDLRIESIAAGGDGVGRLHGMVVFVPRTAPGDLARVTGQRHGRLMRGQLLQLVEPSSARVDPPCEHYVLNRCGGCQIQHLAYAVGQLPAKRRIIHDALRRIGGVEVAEPEVEPSEKQWRYRTKLTLALRRQHEVWIAGLRQYDDPDAIFELKDCPITDEQVIASWRLILANQRFFPEARQLRGAVRLLTEGFSFAMEGAASWSTYSNLFDAVPDMRQLWWQPEQKSRQLLATRAMGGSDEPGASFTQVNPLVARRLREWVTGLASAQSPRRAIDAYSGTGEIAVALAQQGAQVTAIELDRDASRACAARLPAGSRAIAAPVEKALPGALPADIVVLNPPRSGLDRRVPLALQSASAPPNRVIYVSCNPATLARDVRLLDGYRIRSLRAFDMFPQTAHVETVCELEPAA